MFYFLFSPRDFPCFAFSSLDFLIFHQWISCNPRWSSPWVVMYKIRCKTVIFWNIFSIRWDFAPWQLLSVWLKNKLIQILSFRCFYTDSIRSRGQSCGTEPLACGVWGSLLSWVMSDFRWSVCHLAGTRELPVGEGKTHKHTLEIGHQNFYSLIVKKCKLPWRTLKRPKKEENYTSFLDDLALQEDNVLQVNLFN